jgi:hypothetical protein
MVPTMRRTFSLVFVAGLCGMFFLPIGGSNGAAKVNGPLTLTCYEFATSSWTQSATGDHPLLASRSLGPHNVRIEPAMNRATIDQSDPTNLNSGDNRFGPLIPHIFDVIIRIDNAAPNVAGITRLSISIDRRTGFFEQTEEELEAPSKIAKTIQRLGSCNTSGATLF